MSKGKLASQVAHAVCGLTINTPYDRENTTIAVLSANAGAFISKYQALTGDKYMQQDMGLSEVKAGAKTAFAYFSPETNQKLTESIEIERKFLVKEIPAKDLINPTPIIQAYISTNENVSLSITTRNEGASLYIVSTKENINFSCSISKLDAASIGHLLQIDHDKKLTDPIRDTGVIIRVRQQGKISKLTIKGPKTGITCQEFEYIISNDDADILLSKLADKNQVVKTRYHYPFNGHNFEIDVFHKENAGLIIAEVELKSADIEINEFPEGWNVIEVSENKYYNSNLTSHPYSQWENRPQCMIK